MPPRLALLPSLLLAVPALLTAQQALDEPTEGAMKIVDLVKPSVVKITQAGRDGKADEGLGTGFVISDDGLIATNMHVVGQGRKLTVETSEGKQYPVKAVHASDFHLDLAVLRVEAKDLKPLKLGDSDAVKQGQPAYAMGNPEGLTFSVVQGIISAVRDMENGPMLQVAMPIERGNSGGPLLDKEGRVLGILTLKSRIKENLGFAMPVNTLKALLAKPNPVPMERWVTLGVMDPHRWQTLFGAKWTQHAGVIKSEGLGEGFGGRTLCLAQQEQPKVPFEVTLDVRLDDEAGAAGLVLCSDGNNVHYGFYPTGGKLRLTRFDGPDIFSWVPFQTVESAAYRPGDWNKLRVRVEADRLICYVNGAKVIEQEDDTLRSGKIGLCRFRSPGAEFKGLRAGTDLSDKPVPGEVAKRLGDSIDHFLDHPGASGKTVDAMIADRAHSRRVVSDRVKDLEAQAASLRQKAASLRKLNTDLHQRIIATDLSAALGKPEADIDLFQAALLIARHDNPEVDLAAYRHVMERMADDLRNDPKIKKGGLQAVRRINDYLFRENGFHGSHFDYENNANSYISDVLDNREGLPITLSVVFLDLAQRLKVAGVVGLGLPTRFMVGWRKESQSDWHIFDVFDGGKELNFEQASEAALGDKDALALEDLKPASKKETVARMIRNLIGNTRDDNGVPPPEAIPWLTLLIAVDPEDSGTRFQRAAARGMAGDREGAREDLKAILDNPPPAMTEEDLRAVHRMYQGL